MVEAAEVVEASAVEVAGSFNPNPVAMSCKLPTQCKSLFQIQHGALSSGPNKPHEGVSCCCAFQTLSLDVALP